MHVLITTASKHGATQEIAGALAGGLRHRGLLVTVCRPGDVPSLDHYDAVVIGSAVYAGRWLKPALAFVHDHAPALLGLPVWLFSSGPLSVPDPHDDPGAVASVLEATGAVEHRVFAGKLDKSDLSFGERAIARAVKAPEGDFRDWDAVESFAATIADHLNGLRFTRSQRDLPGLDRTTAR
jgi:menaquinone-dependent protoporphyrinogen oxidase